MKKALPIITLFLLLTALIHSGSSQLRAAPATFQGATPFDPIVPGIGVVTSRNMEDGRLSTSNQAIMGPSICIDFGDPYSPLNSPYAPGLYTYQFRIRIPADYPSDIVRVELFDPDSINQATNNVTINRSQIAINNGLTAVASKSCGPNGGSTDQKNPCLLQTDELNLIIDPPNLNLDQVNPWWFVRIDENRGNTADGPPGNGECGNPGIYNPLYNTDTLFELSYYSQDANGFSVEVPLVSYIGQTGDGVRDNGDHLTDMRWVSPGADVPFSTVDDPGANVPAIAQTIDSFEIDLTTDVPNMLTDAKTGDRYIYLDVSALSGASENGYEIWAGPPDYVNSVPSEVNNRNLYILNNPGSHDSMGLELTAVNTLLQNSNFSSPVDIPLATIGPEMAGEVIEVALWDSDAGAQPPWVFYFDTLLFTPDDSNPLGYDPANTDWAMAFGVTGQDDPDGVAEGVRCLPGGCQSQWVDPPYQITIPGDLSNCDWANPTMKDCTPFYGGRLMVRVIGGTSDTYAWELPPIRGKLENKPTLNCTASPIALGDSARSVTAPGTGSNPYPDAADFEYPASPPAYSSFANHVDNLPLMAAETGTLYKLSNGFGSSDFGWLVWNTGISASATTLGNSLTWPGNATDYTNYGDGGTAVPGSSFANVVRGYIEPGDPTDQTLHVGDWIAAYTGVVSDTAVTDPLQTQIDLGRTLRLPVSNNNSSTQYQASRFGLFRLIGYNLSDNWLLLEFVQWEDSCGQLPVSPTAVSLNAPVAGLIDLSYTFTASTPPDTSTPTTYTWEITDQETITNSGGINNIVELEWASPGSKTVTVMAVNSAGIPISQSLTITIKAKQYLPFIIKN
jgi:hypothetical protein